MLLVDMGYSCIKVAWREKEFCETISFDAKPYFPSTVYIDEEGNFEVGWDAHNMREYDIAGIIPSIKYKLRKPSLVLAGRGSGTKSVTPLQVLKEQFRQIRSGVHQFLKAKKGGKYKNLSSTTDVAFSLPFTTQSLSELC